MARTESYRVPAGYKPTPAVVKANPTVKKFSTGQVIKVPAPPISKTQKQSTPLNYTPQYFNPTNITYTGNLPANLPGMYVGQGVTVGGTNFANPTPRAGNVGNQVTVPMYQPSIGGGTATPTTTVNNGGGGGGTATGGGQTGGGIQIAPIPLPPPRMADNDVNVSLNWRIG